MRNVLFITYYFPPAGGAGVQHPTKLAKYLGCFGYRPIVVTVRAEDYSRRSGVAMPLDESRCAELPSGISTIRTRSLQPFKLFDLLSLLRLDYVREFLFLPDEAITWLAPAVSAGMRVARRERVDLVYTHSRPNSTALIGAALKKLLRVPWVADFRDPWSEYFLGTFPTKLHYFVERRIERAVIEKADHVITVTPGATRNLLKAQPNGVARKVTCIPMGYDAADFAGAVSPETPRAPEVLSIVYAGAFCGGPGDGDSAGNRVVHQWRNIRRHLEYRPRLFDRSTHSATYLLEAIAGLYRLRPELRGRIEVRHLGPPEAKHQELAARLGLSGVFESLGYVGHHQAIEEMRRAGALLVCLAEPEAHDFNECVPQKVYEYLAAGPPILALVPHGDVRELLSATGNALVCDPRDVGQIRAALEKLLDSRHDTTRDDSATERFRYDTVTGELAAVFDTVLKGRAGQEPELAAHKGPAGQPLPQSLK